MTMLENFNKNVDGILTAKQDLKRCCICNQFGKNLIVVDLMYVHKECDQTMEQMAREQAERTYSAVEKGFNPEEDNHEQAVEDKEHSEELRRAQYESSILDR